MREEDAGTGAGTGTPAGDAAPCRFTATAYLRDEAPQACIALACACMAFAACRVQGMNVEGSLLVGLLVVACAACAFGADYARKRRFYRDLEDMEEGLSDAGIATSLLEDPAFLEGRIAFDAMCALSRASTRQLMASERDADDYRRYIEAWIHEVKTPVAAAKLVLADMHGPGSDKLSLEVERIESQVESALFYARSSFLSNDYSIARVGLGAVCREACKRNARFLIAAGCTPSIDVPEEAFVLSDKQWVAFMLSQVVVNAAKYGAAHVAFSSRVEEAGSPRERTVLEVADDGPGIPAADVPRVFEMGFVGERGRQQGKATGLGLYLVARLAEAMGIGVAIASEEGSGTRVMLSFPHDMRRLQA